MSKVTINIAYGRKDISVHELMVTENILDIALRHAREAQADAITDLYLVVGELSSIVDDSVQFYWEFVSKGSIAEKATLHFRRVPAKMECHRCRRVYSPHDSLACPDCGSSETKIIAGEEFFLESIDVDKQKTGVPL